MNGHHITGRTTMTFQQAIRELEMADHHLNAVHFRKRHSGNCIREVCQDAMSSFNRALGRVRDAYASEHPNPTVYFSNGQYLDYKTGDPVEGFESGLYVHHHRDGASLMYTWKDSVSGARAMACIDSRFIYMLKYVQ